MTNGRHWKRKGVKWTLEIQEWILARVPAREHGYTRRKEILDELNATFGTDFSENAFVTHCYESGIQLGFCTCREGVARGEKHWRHCPVMSLQEKRGYLRIKVAEPNVWMQYQRYIWEQNHLGESAEGMLVIFMDGNKRNFDPANLERVTRGELAFMANLGHTRDMTRQEREISLMRARLKLQQSKLAGRENLHRLSRKAYYEMRKKDPEYVTHLKQYAQERWKKIKATPELHAKFLAKQREYRQKNRARINARARESNRKRREER